MLGFGQIDTAEIAFGEDRAFCSQAAQVVVAKVLTLEFPLNPDCFVVAHGSAVQRKDIQRVLGHRDQRGLRRVPVAGIDGDHRDGVA